MPNFLQLFPRKRVKSSERHEGVEVEVSNVRAFMSPQNSGF